MLGEPYRVRSADNVVYPDLAAGFTLWEKLRGDAVGPTIRELDMLQLPLSAIPRCMIVDVLKDGDGGLDFVYRYFGTGMATLHNKDYTGKSVRTLAAGDTGERLHGQYVRMVDERVPMIFINTIQTESLDYTYQAVLRLPLSSVGKTVDAVFSMSDFSRDAEAAERQLGLLEAPTS